MKRLKMEKDNAIISSNQNQVIWKRWEDIMTYKIIGDSCLDLTEELRKDGHYQIIPPDAAGGTGDGGG